jgi:hypothetical protein
MGLERKGEPMRRDFYLTIRGKRFGFQYSPIVHERGGPYLTRWILYLGWICLRLHKFYRGDHDRASHTHPWWFITFPFSDYKETVYHHGCRVEGRPVERWRFHYRPANFEHIVNHRLDRKTYENCFAIWQRSTKPFWTFVIASGNVKKWGFYKPDGAFVPHDKYDYA